MPADNSCYEAMFKKGASPHEVWRAATSDGLGTLESLKLLRFLYGLSLLQCKEVMAQVEGFENLSEYQEKVILPMVEETAQNGVFDDDWEDRLDAGK